MRPLMSAVIIDRDSLFITKNQLVPRITLSFKGNAMIQKKRYKRRNERQHFPSTTETARASRAF